MEYIEHNLAPLSTVVIGLAAKKLFKKELVPVTGWKQMLSTYLTVTAGIFVGLTLKGEIIKEIQRLQNLIKK